MSVVLTGTFMVVYVIFGGMLATTWVQIIKAGMLMTAGVVLTVLVLAETGFDPVELFRRAADESSDPDGFVSGGLQHPDAINGISFGIAFALGTAGLPHILIRFFTVPDARAARSSVWWAVLLIGLFYIMIMIIGVGARAILGAGAEEASAGGNLAAPLLAEELGGGAGTVGGDLFLAVISAVAFATILAVVAGLVISASGAVAHDLWSNVVRHGHESEHEEVLVARIAALVLAVLAIIASILGGEAFNVSILVGLAFAVAASANLPALLLALFWPRFNTMGAVCGVLGGLLVSVVLIILSPAVWPGPDSEGSPVPLSNPTLISFPLGFLFCWLGTVLSSSEGTTAPTTSCASGPRPALGSEGSRLMERPDRTEMTPVAFLARSAGLVPDHTAVVHGERRCTYGELAARANRLASALPGGGLEHLDRVAVLCPNTPAILEAHFGVPAAGGVLVPINVRLHAREVAEIVGHAQPRWILVDSRAARRALRVRPRRRRGDRGPRQRRGRRPLRAAARGRLGGAGRVLARGRGGADLHQLHLGDDRASPRARSSRTGAAI